MSILWDRENYANLSLLIVDFNSGGERILKKQKGRNRQRKVPKKKEEIIPIQRVSITKAKSMCDQLLLHGGVFRPVKCIGDENCKYNQFMGGNNCSACIALFYPKGICRYARAQKTN